MGLSEMAAVALTTAAVTAYEGEQQRKQTNRALGAQPRPPNTSQPDESALNQNRPTAANGRAGTLLAPPMGSSPLPAMPSLGLGIPTPTAKNTLG